MSQSVKVPKVKANNRRAIAFHPNGTVTEHDYHRDNELEVLQGLVGGYIEGLNRKILTINDPIVKERSKGKKLYVKDERTAEANPAFTVTNTHLTPNAPRILDAKTFKQYSYKEDSPVSGVVVAVGNLPK